MAVRILPDSSITSMVSQNDIYTYAQADNGDIYEFRGSVSSGVYDHDRRKTRSVLLRYKTKDNTYPDAPKFFTPIAAVAYTKSGDSVNEKFLIYVDDNNVLHDQHYQNDNDGFVHGGLSALNIKPAAYSKLAAVRYRNTHSDGMKYNFIAVYYQDSTHSGGIRMVYWHGYFQRWETGTPDLKDPPLLGTSLTALPPRAGIAVYQGQSDNDADQPVYYLQMDDNTLGNAQGVSEPRSIGGLGDGGKKVTFSPHTSVTAVDTGKEVYLIYKSNASQADTIRIADCTAAQPVKFLEILDTAPRSDIAAALVSGGGSGVNVVLFFQVLDRDTETVRIYAQQISRSSEAAAWSPADKIQLGE